jgi:N-acetylmuramoyl-L-alanine amidase
MMLFVNGPKSFADFTERIVLRYVRTIALLLVGVIITGSIAMVISEFDVHGHGRVYAVTSSEGEGGKQQQFQTGLMGVMNGVRDMEEFSDDARMIRVSDANEEVLAGVSGLDRRMVHKETIGQGTGKAAELGYYAQQIVLTNQMSSDEYYTLLQIVEAEATGGDIISKMMVAGVVLNRVRDSHFPNTIYEVVWQKEQFQPTADGRIYSCEITDSTIEAVERVLMGEDYSQGALFFFARDSAEASNANWFDSSLAWLCEYGGHEFFTYKEYVNN